MAKNIISLQGYDIELPSPPKDKELIFGYNEKKADQFWRRPYEYTDQEFIKLSQARQREISDEEFRRRTEGFWFMNNGEPTWIPGGFYFFLTHWTIDGRHPYYMRQQRYNALFRHHCKNDPLCYGWLVLKPRRAGETQEELSDGLNELTMTFDAHMGIQSKTGEDAQKVNFGALVNGFEKMPYWMKPSVSGNLKPKKELVFDKPREQATKRNQGQIYNELFLRSRVDWRPTTSNAYDGSKLKRFIGDEIGKLEECSAAELWQIVKLCLTDGFDLIGKAALLSTIGETSQKAADNFKAIWEASDIRKRNDNGSTESGLYRWFIPAWTTLRGNSPLTGKPIIDRYGNIDEAEGKQILLNERKGIKDARKLSILIKQKPLTAQEALDFGGSGNTFDKVRVTGREAEIEQYVPPQGRDEFVLRGNFDWIGGERFNQAIFLENPKGKFLIHPEGVRIAGFESNRIKSLPNGQYAPYSDTPFIFGVDSFDYDIDNAEDDDQYSKGGILGKVTVNLNNPDKSHTYILEYLERPSEASEFYEDVLMAAWYFGAKINVERSNYRIFDYLKRHNAGGFLLKRPSITKGSAYKDADNRDGTPATDEIWGKGIDYIQSYIAPPNPYLNENQRDYLKDFWFRRTLDQLKNFNYANKKKFDLIAAMVQCEIGARSVYHNPNKKDNGDAGYMKVIKAFFPNLIPDDKKKKQPQLSMR